MILRNRVLGLLGAVGVIAGSAATPIRTAIGGIPVVGKMLAPARRRQAKRSKTLLDPKTRHTAQVQAGIRPGMCRRRRRALARAFAKKMNFALPDRVAVGMSRAVRRRCQKAIAAELGGMMLRYA